MSDSNNVTAQFGQIPLGGIIMWFGPLALIPKGWLLCDGEEGRPNLVNRFPLGTDDPGDEGGAAEVKLTIANLPSHNHGGATDPQYEFASRRWSWKDSGAVKSLF